MPLVPHMLQALLPRRHRSAPAPPAASASVIESPTPPRSTPPPHPTQPLRPTQPPRPTAPLHPTAPPHPTPSRPIVQPTAPLRAPSLPRASLASVSKLHALLAAHPGARVALRRVAVQATRGDLIWTGAVSFDERLVGERSCTQCAAYAYSLPQRAPVSERLPNAVHVDEGRLMPVEQALQSMVAERAMWLLRVSPVDRFGSETVSSPFMRALLALQTRQQAVLVRSGAGQWLMWPVLFPLYGLCLVAVFVPSPPS